LAVSLGIEIVNLKSARSSSASTIDLLRSDRIINATISEVIGAEEECSERKKRLK